MIHSVNNSGDGTEATLPRLAAVPVAIVAGLAVIVLLAAANRYGWHRDELYFLEAGKHLALGYVDQPPLTPLLARVANALAPGSLLVLRIPSALATALTVALAALIARELGGARRAQVLAAGAIGGAGFVLGAGHLLATATFDLTAWMALLWLFVRLTRTDDPRWWLAWGAVAGISLWNKDLLTLLAFTVGMSLVLTGRWRLAINRWAAAGGALALLVALPQLMWQASHGWPQVAMARVLSHRIGALNRVELVPSQLILLTPVLVPLMFRGIRWLWRSSDLRPLAVAWPVGMAAAFVTGGRPYYVIPLTAVLAIAGIVVTDQARPSVRLERWVIASALVTMPLALPILPASMLASSHIAVVNEAVAETVGWPQLVDQVAVVVRSLPAEERSHVIVLAGTYGEAGAVDLFGPERGLPAVFSPHNSYWYFRHPTDDKATVVAVRWPLAELTRFFRRCQQVTTVDNGLGVASEVQGQPIAVCRDLRQPWAVTWPSMRFLA